MYSLSESVTIDEMLRSFRGRCGFVQYMLKKPAKYGIKIFMLCDSANKYMSNAVIYSGKDPSGSITKNISSNIVLELSEIIKNTGRNITTDNWFTSVKLAEELLQRKLTLVGTIKKNKPEIPVEFKESPKREVYSSLFAFSDNITLTSYVPKKGKAVCLISSMHTDSNIIENEKRKPEIILYYNKNKSGVDTFDQMVSNYSVRRKTKRWPLSVFYCMVDIASINAFILFNIKSQILINRREFIQSLIKSLVMPQTVSRLKTPNLSFFTKQQIRKLFNIPEPSEKRNKKS